MDAEAQARRGYSGAVQWKIEGNFRYTGSSTPQLYRLQVYRLNQ